MEQKRLNHLEQIPQKDWEKTETSVKKLVKEMAQQIEQQEKKLSKSVEINKTMLRNVNRLETLTNEATCAIAS